MKKSSPPQNAALKEYTEKIEQAEHIRKLAHAAFTKKIKTKSGFSSLKEWKAEGYEFSADAIAFQKLANDVANYSAEMSSNLATFSAAFNLANSSITQLASDVATLNAMLVAEDTESATSKMTNALQKEVLALDQKSEEFKIENLDLNIGAAQFNSSTIPVVVTVLTSNLNALNAAVAEYLKLV
jgi:hypothetical protein